MRMSLPYLAASLIVVASGVFHGLWTDRFARSHELRDAIARIDLIPMNFGDWSGTPAEIGRRELEAAGIAGSMMRHYENRRDGSRLDVLLVCGRPGPIGVHTPDICYTGVGYALQADQAKTLLSYGDPARAAEAWRGDFLKQGSVAPSGLRIFWSWTDGKGWKAADNPRLTFSGRRALYKLYVIRSTGGNAAAPVEGDPGIGFLGEFLPVLDRALGISPP